MATIHGKVVLTKSMWLNRFCDPSWNQSQSLPPGTRFQHTNYPPLEPGGFASMKTSGVTSSVATIPLASTATIYSADTTISMTGTGHVTMLLKLLGDTTISMTCTGIVKGVAAVRGTTDTLQGASEQSITEAVWGALAVSFNSAGSMGSLLNDAGTGGNALTLAQAIALGLGED